jgi:hypothetical protein
MKNKFLLLGIALAALTACKTASSASSMQIAEVKTQKNISINNELKNDEEFVNNPDLVTSYDNPIITSRFIERSSAKASIVTAS